MAAPHADREHATWSASSTERNWMCAGAIALTQGLPERTSEAADWGTACHQLAEKCLRGHGPADKYIGKIEKGKVHEFEVDEEMAETAQTYVDYVTGRLDSVETLPEAQLSVEQHFTLNSLKPPFDAGGTADAVIYFPGQKLLEVIDLKGGRGVVVEVKGNPQLRTYALGAMLAKQGLDVQRVTVTIVQPRAPHKDGRIRSETFHVADLVEWTADLLDAMEKSAEALRWHQTIGRGNGEFPTVAAWGSDFLDAGSHCKFCKAAATCPALERKAVDTAGIWFDDLDQPRLANVPDTQDPDERKKRLDMLDMMEDWIKAVRANEHALAESGSPATDYILVPKQGREKWNDGVEAKVAEIARAAGLKSDSYLNPPKLRTPKQVRAAAEKIGMKATVSALASLSTTPDAGANLVAASKTTRAAVAPAVNKHFSPIED